MHDQANYQQILVIVDDCEDKCKREGMTGQGILSERLKAYQKILDVLGRGVENEDDRE